MISRVIADFDSAETANTAVQRAKQGISYVYSGHVTAHGNTDHSINHMAVPDMLNTHASLISAVNGQIYGEETLSARKQQKVSACIICGSGAVENVVSMLHAMGAENIRSAV